MGGFVSGKNESGGVVINALELEKVAGRQGQPPYYCNNRRMVKWADLTTIREDAVWNAAQYRARFDARRDNYSRNANSI